MKLFYSYMERLCVYIIHFTSLYLSLTPAIIGHKLVYVLQVLFALPFCFIMFSYAQAQSPDNSGAGLGPDIKSLTIGDTIPERIWKIPSRVINHPQHKRAVTLNDYREKLIVLDFWNTWCGSCLTSLKHSAPLAQKYGSDIAILPVTKQSRTEIEQFRKKNDSLLSAIFPHVLFPHVIFIKNGKIIHIGGLESTDEKNLLAHLHDRTDKSIRIKNDFAYTSPLIGSSNEMITGNTYYRALTAYRKDSPSLKGQTDDTLSNTKRVYYYNYPLFDLIKEALAIDSIPLNRVVFTDNVWNLGNFAYHRNIGEKDRWLQTNSYCYEVNLPINHSDSSIRQLLLKDMEGILGLNVKVDIRAIEVLEITENIAQTKRRRAQDALSVDYLVDAYNRLPTSVPLTDPRNLAPGSFFVKNSDYSKWKENELLAAIRESGLKIQRKVSDQKVLVVERRSK